jgi:4'-phosphopantetheinyl transferase EntD
MALAAVLRRARYFAEETPRIEDLERLEAALFPEERTYVAGAVAKRRVEFAAGRLCARRALAAMGEPPAPLVARNDGSPRWPAGIVGSITHTRGYCAAVVDRHPPLRAVGIDAEEVRLLEPDTVRSIVTAGERAWLATQPEGRQPELAILFFSAKEAFYKCQYPLTGTFLDFGDVEIDLSAAIDGAPVGRFVARVTKIPFPTALTRMEGNFACGQGRVVCGVELPA